MVFVLFRILSKLTKCFKSLKNLVLAFNKKMTIKSLKNYFKKEKK